MRNNFLFLLLLVGLTSPLGLRGQSRWHKTNPDGVDTSYSSFSISCNGEDCVAAGGILDVDTFHYSLLFHSPNGGLTWSTVDSVPQWVFNTHGKIHTLFRAVQQIDDLNAIAIDELGGCVIRTFDGWNTWSADTSNRLQLYGVHFSNPAEGMINEGFGWFISTTDTGKHWKQIITQSGDWFHAYGNGVFRLFSPPSIINAPGTMFTTHDNWTTADTSYILLNGPFMDTNVYPYALVFGSGDTIAIIGNRWDSTHTHFSVMMAISSDLGANWLELPLPKNIDIYPPTVTPIDKQSIVIYGEDSVNTIVISTDRGRSWEADTIALDNGKLDYRILSVAVSGSGRITASIWTDSNGIGLNRLEYWEPRSSSVIPAVSPLDNLRIYPNPATNTLNIENTITSIAVLDPLGRVYSVPKNGNSLDVSSLPSGVYFLSDGTSRTKFVKQ